jgi:MYXO-CTERM domain-containing protein
MTNRWMTGRHTALLGIAVSLFGVGSAWAQGAAPDAGDEGSCTASQLPLECPDRCPSYTTCFIDEGEGRLYYRVQEERFECDGLVCDDAKRELDDYCCQRGDYAPSRGGGGCSVAPAGAASRGELAAALVSGALLLAGRRRRRV